MEIPSLQNQSILPKYLNQLHVMTQDRNSIKLSNLLDLRSKILVLLNQVNEEKGPLEIQRILLENQRFGTKEPSRLFTILILNSVRSVLIKEELMSIESLFKMEVKERTQSKHDFEEKLTSIFKEKFKSSSHIEIRTRSKTLDGETKKVTEDRRHSGSPKKDNVLKRISSYLSRSKSETSTPNLKKETGSPDSKRKQNTKEEEKIPEVPAIISIPLEETTPPVEQFLSFMWNSITKDSEVKNNIQKDTLTFFFTDVANQVRRMYLQYENQLLHLPENVSKNNFIAFSFLIYMEILCWKILVQKKSSQIAFLDTKVVAQALSFHDKFSFHWDRIKSVTFFNKELEELRLLDVEYAYFRQKKPQSTRQWKTFTSLAAHEWQQYREQHQNYLNIGERKNYPLKKEENPFLQLDRKHIIDEWLTFSN